MRVFESPIAHDVTRIEAASRTFMSGGSRCATIEITITTIEGSAPIKLYADAALADEFDALAKSIAQIFTDTLAAQAAE